jgi:tRNA(Ile)-lysidine synthase
VSSLSYDRVTAGDPAAPALIGVSGGRDSVALLHALWSDGFRRLIVCHFNHRWRGQKSGEDAESVRGLAARYELEFECEYDAAPIPREAAAREARFAFFACVAGRRGVPRLLLAHHADDQVETFLFNLLRGAAGPGLGGMQPLRRRTIEGIELEIARPLLGCWRAEIDAYVAAHALDFRDDASNDDLRHTRNRLRHGALPKLRETVGRPVDSALWKAAAILAGENEYFATLPVVRDIPVELTVQSMRGLHAALQRRVIHAWLRSHLIESIGFEEVEAIRAMLTNDSPAKVNLAGNRHARRREGKLFITPSPPPTAQMEQGGGSE